MAEGKETFVLHTSIIHTIRHLKEEQQGKLFMHILKYVNDEDPETDDPLIAIAFEPIKQQLKKDLKKWKIKVEANRENGKKGGRPRKNPLPEPQPDLFEQKPSETQETQRNPEEPKKPSGFSGLNGSTTQEPPKPAVKSKPLEERKKEFIEKVTSYVDNERYTKELAKAFIMYWTEHEEGDKKMRFERQKPFAVKNRMYSWYNKNKTMVKEKPRY